MIHPSHVLYQNSDFTNEEYERRNILAVLVIEGDLAICKICGEAEAGLVTSCKYNQQAARKEWQEVDNES